MKPTPYFILALWAIGMAVLLALLTGCAGLSVNFDASITYRSDVPLGGRK
jgi:hypothetical protein